MDLTTTEGSGYQVAVGRIILSITNLYLSANGTTAMTIFTIADGHLPLVSRSIDLKTIVDIPFAFRPLAKAGDRPGSKNRMCLPVTLFLLA